jgi:hypothetical protein
MKRLVYAFGVLSVTLALGSGCSTSSSHSNQPAAMGAAAPVAPAPQPQPAPAAPAPSVYTPPVAVSPSTPEATTEQTRIVEFKIKAPDASKAYLAGEFNGWSETDMPMTKQANGEWSASMALKPGTYQYKFIVDDKWITDPDNPEHSDDGFGGNNSVLHVPEPGKTP